MIFIVIVVLVSDSCRCHTTVPKSNQGNNEEFRLPENSSNLTKKEIEEKYHVEAEYLPTVSVDHLIHDLTMQNCNKSAVFQSINRKYYKSLKASSRALSPVIDILMVDTEGHDILVIKGAKQLLKHRAIRLT